MQKIMTTILVALVKGYQLALSPFFGQQCRFTPTCSQYAIEALQAHGSVKGVWLVLKRVLRCHPWHAGGHDPIPK
jgi:putative membrane protein insertion efficiency factor